MGFDFEKLVSEKKHIIFIWLILGVFTSVFFLLHSNYTQDDAYITYRYARNIASGMGFVYNPGEWVLGTTTPLYTILLASINYLTRIDISKISLFVSCISFWIASGVLYHIGRLQGFGLALSVSLIFITNPLMKFFIGMESFLLLFMMLLSIWTYLKGRFVIASMLSGLAVLVRYEMILLLVIFCIHYFITRREVKGWIFSGTIPILAWMINSFCVFGSTIPLSATAKIAAPRIPFLVGLASYWYSFVDSVRLSFVIIVFFLVGLFITVLGRMPRFGYSLILIFGLAYLGIVTFLAGSFPWYYAPLIPSIAILVTFGIDYLSKTPYIVDFSLNDGKKELLSKAIFSVAAGTVITIQLTFWYDSFQLYRNQVFDHRYYPYRQVSNWLLENASTDDSIATFEIGFIGYFTDMKIIDLAGLVTPDLLPWVDDGIEETLIHSLRLYSPDYVLISSNADSNKGYTLDDARYKMVKRFENRYLLYKKMSEY